MITLGSRQFTGPFISRLWSPPRAPGLYAVMVPGWRLLMFHAVHFGHAEDLSVTGLLKEHPKYGYWMTSRGANGTSMSRPARCTTPPQPSARRRIRSS